MYSFYEIHINCALWFYPCIYWTEYKLWLHYCNLKTFYVFFNFYITLGTFQYLISYVIIGPREVLFLWCSEIGHLGIVYCCWAAHQSNIVILKHDLMKYERLIPYLMATWWENTNYMGQGTQLAEYVISVYITMNIYIQCGPRWRRVLWLLASISPSVHLSVYLWTLICPHENSSEMWSEITKLAQSVHHWMLLANIENGIINSFLRVLGNLACPLDNLSRIWARTTKCAPNMHLEIFSDAIENGGH